VVLLYLLLAQALLPPAALCLADDGIPRSQIRFSGDDNRNQGEEDLKQLQVEVKKQNEKIERLQENIIEHKLKILDSKQKERSVLDELEKIDRNLGAQRKTLASINTQYEKQENLLQEKEVDLEQLTSEKEALGPHVMKRLAAYYRTGPLGFINVLFSAESLPELLGMQEYFHLLIQYDQEAIKSLRAKISRLKEAKKEHSREKDRLLAMREQVTEEKEQLAMTQEGKKSLLHRVKTEKKLYEQAAGEIEKAAQDLAETLRKIRMTAISGPEETIAGQVPPAPARQSVVSSRPRKPTSKPPAAEDTFAAQQGKLPPPVEGVVTTYFDPLITKQFAGKSKTGISIKSVEGADIKAVYGGRVINTGHMKGYGNLLIIDHGGQYYSVTSQAAKFYKKEGEPVAAGEVIGIMGDNEALIGDGLHFEIRHSAKPLDPLQWLDKTRLQFNNKS